MFLTFCRYLKADKNSETEKSASETMIAGVEKFVAAMSETGPFFFGAEAGVVDIAFAPFALRIEIFLTEYKGFSLPVAGPTWSRYAAWWQAMRVLPAFVKSMPQQETYEARLLGFYVPYSQGGGQEDVTKAA